MAFNNGGSLEDCYSNVFALTDLNGLKWRCFVTPNNAPRGVPVQSDFVLKAYSKCLQDGMMCTWRRKPLNLPTSCDPLPVPSFINDISKELWIFWYSNDPPEKMEEYTSQLGHHDENEGDISSITYEVRVLFFKALHTVVARTLMKQGIVRIGRWFSRPVPQHLQARAHLISQYSLAFNLHFFVHGGNTVCLTINAQRQPTLLKLAKRHMEHRRRLQVVLGPWSLKGFLLPPSERNDPKAAPSAKAQYEDWNSFIPLDIEDDMDELADSANDVPKMVHVEVNGIRMLHPSSLVCVMLDDDVDESDNCSAPPSPTPRHPAMTPLELITNSDKGERRNPLLVQSMNGLLHFQGVVQNIHFGRRNQVTTPASQEGFREPFPATADDDTKWNFVDPGKSERCRCGRCSLRIPPAFGAVPEPCACEVAVALPALNPTSSDQKRTNPLYIALKKSKMRKIGMSFHHRWLNGNRPRSPPVSLDRKDDDLKSESSSEEEWDPAWSSTQHTKLRTSLQCRDETATYHYPASPTNYSDEENFPGRSPSPFTPIRVISPCNDCTWPSAPADQLSEATFSEIFKPGSSSSLPSTASREDRARDYDYYFNPTLRDEPVYMAYHSRRQGEKRRSASYPPVFTSIPSPEQPGSQETIPATTSPLHDMDMFDRMDECSRDSSSTIPFKSNGDNETMKKRRVRAQGEGGNESAFEIEPPQQALDKLSIINHDTVRAQDQQVPVDSFYTKERDVEEDDDPLAEDEVEVEYDDRALGEGTSTAYDSSSCEMEVDVLSPPASNERPEAHSMGFRGPPSVSDMSQMNSIYPTPPSIQSEAQQFSPAADCQTRTADLSNVKQEPQDSADEPMATENEEMCPPSTSADDSIVEPSEPIYEFESGLRPYLPNIIKSGKFKSIHDITSAFSPVRLRYCFKKKTYRMGNRFVVELRSTRDDLPNLSPFSPPKSYEKIRKKVTREQTQPPEVRANPPPITTNVGSHPPVAHAIHPSYKPAFSVSGPVSQGYGPHGGMVPGGGYGYGNGPGQMHMGRPTPGMGPMMNRGMPPYGQPPYSQGASGMGGYNNQMAPPHMMGHQNSVQQLNNFVNGPIPPGPMYGGPPIGMSQMGMPPHHMGMGNMNMYNSGPMMPPGQMMPYGIDPNHHMMHGNGSVSNSPYMGMPHGPSSNQYGQIGPPSLMRQGSLNQMDVNQMIMGPNQGLNVSQNYSAGSNGGIGVMSNQNQSGFPLQSRDNMFAEGASVVLSIILQDTILDLHFDTVFDSCPICSCTGSIRARELGLYITPPDVLRNHPHQQQSAIQSWSGFYTAAQTTSCQCGFSAVRHRYLSMQAGLFPEDSKEATGFGESSVAPIAGDRIVAVSSQTWFDPSNFKDLAMLNQLRLMCLRTSPSKTVHQFALFHEYADKMLKGQTVGFSIGSNAEYIVSHIDSTELLLLGNSTIDLACLSGTRPPTTINHEHKFMQFFHPWGLQLANEIREPKEHEWRALLSEISPVLETSMKNIRRIQTNDRIVEGPLTWKSLVAKRQRAQQQGSEDDSHLAEPIPYVLVATEKDLIRTSPQSIRLWEQLSLGPVDQPKDVLYLTVIPDNSEIHDKAIKFMDQLSALYERMRLGRHIGWCGGDIRDGIVRTGGRNTGKYQHKSFDFLDLLEKYIDDRLLMARLRLYTQQMEETLSSIFRDNANIFDRAAYRVALATDQKIVDQKVKKIASNISSGPPEKGGNSSSATQSSTDSAVKTEANSSSQQQFASSNSNQDGTNVKTEDTLHELLKGEDNVAGTSTQSSSPDIPQVLTEDIPEDDYGTLPHVIVIYVVNPFTWGSESHSGSCARISTLALIRTFNDISKSLCVGKRTQLQLELIPLEQLGDLQLMAPDFTSDGHEHMNVFERVASEKDFADTYVVTDTLRPIALSVYSAPRVLQPNCVEAVKARTMTKFGPGSAMLDAMVDIERQTIPSLYTVPCSPYHLAPTPMLTQDSATNKITQFPLDEQVLYVAYCLIGADFLCAAVTDASGKLSDNCLINIRISANNSHRKHRNKTQILDAMGRLWNYIQGFLFTDIRNWRLVIGRLGKIGHGEFKAWNHLLSKSVLRRVSARPKESCNACFESPGISGVPVILSACLVSFEPEPFVRLFPGFGDAQVKGKKALLTPEDVSATHIMVFPAMTHVDLSTGNDQAIDFNDDDFFGVVVDDEMNDIALNVATDSSADGPQPSASFRTGNQFFSDNFGSEQVENQPLAFAFYISTAPAGDLPDWFWASCPSARRRTPVHLKAALHLNVQCSGTDQDQGDDLMPQKSQSKDGLEIFHPLDSNRTDEVLRHVLETYNSLSWLNVDVVTGERKSCLPIHMQALLRLYHSVARLIM